jgi:hypothetical protein
MSLLRWLLGKYVDVLLRVMWAADQRLWLGEDNSR